MKKKKCQKRRYILHQRIKEFASYNAKNRSVEIFYDDENIMKNRYIVELVSKFHYNIQLSISTTKFVYLQTNTESPSEIKLHRVPGSRPFAISYYQDNDEKKLITKCFSQKFQYVGKLSRQKGHKLSKKLNKNFDYHIIIF